MSAANADPYNGPDERGRFEYRTRVYLGGVAVRYQVSGFFDVLAFGVTRH